MDGLHTSFCRLCNNCCPMIAEVVDGRLVSVTGDRENVVYEGYTCVKGRSYPAIEFGPDRLLHSQKRVGDGFRAVPVATAMDEVAAALQDIVERHGPRSVALYGGVREKTHAANWPMATAFISALGSPMYFTANTIDQPGKAIAKGLHGAWMAPLKGSTSPTSRCSSASTPSSAIAAPRPGTSALTSSARGPAE